MLRHPVRYDGQYPGLRTAPPSSARTPWRCCARPGFSAAEVDGYLAAGVVFA